MGETGTDYSASNTSLLTVKIHKTIFETDPLFPSPWHLLSKRIPKTNTWEFLSLSVFWGWGGEGVAAIPCGLQDLSSPTRARTQGYDSESTES